MDQLGIPKQKQKPKPKQPKPPEPEQPDQRPGVDSSPRTGDTTGSGGATPRRITFAGRVQKLLIADCKICHASGAAAGSTSYSISDDFDTDYEIARRLVDLATPERSVLLTKATGENHGGGTIFAAGSAKHALLLEWIQGGALRGITSKAAVAPAPERTKKPQPDSKAKSTVGKVPAAHATPAEELPDSSEVAPVSAFVWHTILQDKCASCHGAGGFASDGFGLSGDPEQDYPEVMAHVDRQDPEGSPLLTKARGVRHGGGAVIDTGSNEYAELLAWIGAGAPGPTADVPPEKDTAQIDATTGASPRVDEPGQRLGDGTSMPVESVGSRLPFSLPFHLRLNGRFDLSYERRDYKDHPFGPGRNALATYHHFLFLSRSGAADPFGFNIELITQQFFEFNARFTTKDERAKFLVKAGKILVPFGDEPLFHSSYGGKTGFDQALLPVVWSQPGIAFNVHLRAGPVSIANDAYAIRGYRLRAPDGVLDLRSDSSSFDDFEFGVGDRIGLSWAPLTAWYSFQLNPLGHGRLLFMQAFDFELWRVRDVPFLQDIVVGFGAMRADVSGGGPGRDYYHFGSYGQVRYYPIDWLYVQYRWGLMTFDNRRGLYFDATRIDERDNSSHNLSVGAIWKGLYVTLQMFWNLEKANEQDNDFMRFTVGYAF